MEKSVLGVNSALSFIMLGDYEVQVQVENLQKDSYKYDSGTEYLQVGWFYEKYQYREYTQNGKHKFTLKLQKGKGYIKA